MYDKRPVVHYLPRMDTYFCNVVFQQRNKQLKIILKKYKSKLSNKVMRTIISIFFLIMLNVAAFANTGVSNGDTEKGKKKKSRSAAKGQIEMLAEEEPVISLVNPAAQANAQVTVKVFDIKGKIVMEKKVQMESIFNKNYTLEDLPKGSIFVMLHDNTVYYFKES